MILLFDTETTGIPRNWNAPATDIENWPRLVQLAFRLYDIEGELIITKSYIIKPNGFVIPPDSVKIHSITNEIANDKGVDLYKVLSIFRRAISMANLIVGHNIQFDKKVLNCEYYRFDKTLPLEGIEEFCTMTNYKITDYCQLPPKKMGSYKWPKLSELHYILFNTNFSNAHNATTDVEITARCFWELLKRKIIQIDLSKKGKKDIQEKGIDSHTKERIEIYCLQNDIFEVPLDVKVAAILFLEHNFTQIPKELNLSEQVEFLLSQKTDKNYVQHSSELNIFQKNFICKTKLSIINEHKDFQLFNGKTDDEKIRVIENLRLHNILQKIKLNDLVIYFHTHYIALYEKFTTEQLLIEQEINKNELYQSLSTDSKHCHEKISKLLDNVGSELAMINIQKGKEAIPNAIYEILTECHIELQKLEMELGKTHEIFEENAFKIVLASFMFLQLWITKAPKELFYTKTNNAKLGTTYLDACDTIFSKINSIKFNEDNTIWYENFKNTLANYKNTTTTSGKNQ